MKISLSVVALALAASVAAVVAASAQSTPLTPPLTPPTLEGTIKVYPVPQVQPRQQAPAAAASAACICTQQYDPVCARTGQSAWTTYSNACVATCAGATEIRPGPC